MSVQNRISITLSPRMKKALELAAGLDGSTTATYAAQLLSVAIKNDIKEDPILFEKWTELERQAIKNESWDDVTIPVTVESEDLQIPATPQKGWFLSGDNPDCYEVGTDRSITYNEQPSGFIKSKRQKVQGFGTLMQQVNIEAYAGKKLELVAAIKVQGVKEWAGLWFRLDDEEMKVLSFNNMQDKPLKGTADWKQVSHSFKIPKNSSTLNFGVLLVGTGSVWINDIKLTELADSKKKSITDLDIALEF